MFFVILLNYSGYHLKKKHLFDLKLIKYIASVMLISRIKFLIHCSYYFFVFN